jgi:DNA-binding response OmpR family regulator
VKKNLEKLYRFPWGNLTFQGTEVISTNGSVNLSFQEYKILKILLQHRGIVVSREVLFYTIWNTGGNPKSRILDVHISSIRKKLKTVIPQNYCHHIITSIRGKGYIIR